MHVHADLPHTVTENTQQHAWRSYINFCMRYHVFLVMSPCHYKALQINSYWVHEYMAL